MSQNSISANVSDFSEYITQTFTGPFGGASVELRFPNGYGASVARTFNSYGADSGYFEVAVLEADGYGDMEFCYDTPITNDVIGWQDVAQVRTLLAQIIAL